MWRAGLRALWSHWRRRPFQLLTLVTGLALATALWSGVQAINAEARASYDQAASALGERRFAQLLPQEGKSIPLETFAEIRRAGWLVSPIVEGRIDFDGTSYRLIGFDPLTAPSGFAPDAAGDIADFSGFFTPPYQIFANPVDAARIAPHTLARVTPVEALAPGIVLTDLTAAQTWLDTGPNVSRLLVLPDQPFGITPPDAAAFGLTLRQPQQGGDIQRLTDSFHLNLTAFGLLSFAVGLFIVHGTIGLAFEQRRGLFRTLRALGLPLRALLTLIAVELLVIALVAGTIGMILGYVIAAALLPDVAATLRGLYGADIAGTMSLRPSWWLAGMAIAVLGTAVAAAGAFVKVIRLPLLTPAQPRAWARLSEKRMATLALIAAGLALAALVLTQMGGLLAGFALLGAMLIGAALVLPILLFALLALAQRLTHRPLAQWFWADTRQQLPGLSLALMALLLALATNIGVGTMVSSFRLTFTGWLDQRLASELYVTARSDAEGAELQAFLQNRADAVLPIWHIQTRVAGLPADIYGAVDHATYRDNWPMIAALPEVWDRVADGRGALINEQLALREGFRPGDRLDLPGQWQIEIAGIYSDYGNPTGQVIVGLSHLVDRFSDVPKRRFGLRIAPDAAPDLTRTLREEFGLPADNIIDQASIKAFSLRVFERTFTVTGALNVLTLAIAGFAILTSLLTLASLRQPQLAPVWALGMTRRQLAALELLRALLLAMLTVLAALPVGLLLAWVLLNIVNVEAFGWRLPMHIFPGDWLRLAGLSLLAATLAALWPARKLARTPPTELLKVFANER